MSDRAWKRQRPRSFSTCKWSFAGKSFPKKFALKLVDYSGYLKISCSQIWLFHTFSCHQWRKVQASNKLRDISKPASSTCKRMFFKQKSPSWSWPWTQAGAPLSQISISGWESEHPSKVQQLRLTVESGNCPSKSSVAFRISKNQIVAYLALRRWQWKNTEDLLRYSRPHAVLYEWPQTFGDIPCYNQCVAGSSVQVGGFPLFVAPGMSTDVIQRWKQLSFN